MCGANQQVNVTNYRLAKEKQMYEKEVSDYKEKIEKMKADKSDSYDIKKTVWFVATKILAVMMLVQTKHCCP